ncbi:hypothetical protein Poli38472_012323 [Pythium oligandrum]|uniref:phospholipase D n=1 Tax=Pythium oligandrum TaxID=41045 RepID=A0A8K1CP79_PYTOL|nr:hypothetical protein Poli38472_012323 [Pythium oligandrum]|eukprot:TMW67207.1 hypothetical protein Poli38472_012323 [Pythium oligandrum]
MRPVSATIASLAAVACVLYSAPSVEALRSGVSCRVLKNPINMATQRCICTPCHVCEYSFIKFSCKMITGKDVDTTDGSEIKPQQPTLEAAQWFLTKEEMTKSRGGVERNDLATFTEGNTVVAYPAADEVFMSVYNDIEKMGDNDLVYLSAWSTDEIPFDPINDPTGAKTGFKSVMGRVIERGADFRALVWPNLLEGKQNKAIRDYINGLAKPKANGPARFVFDDRLPKLASSHHQKALVLRQQDKLIAYLGGIDLTSDRWDTLKHDRADVRENAKINRAFKGWLDAQVRIEGPASKDVGANFLQRWNSDFLPAQDLVDDMTKFANPDFSDLPALDAGVQLNIPTDGKHAVQITRTFSCKYKNYKEFAPKGETSLLQARIKAIKAAKNYVYIEDQYFILVPELLDALLEVMPRLQRVIVVVQRTLKEYKATGYEKYFFDMVAPIQKKYPNKFQLYSTKEASNLYIHTKAVVIDDVYVSIGSANWNRRSMTSDSEIGANVVDTETMTTPDGILVGKLVHDFRVKKFQEMTGKSFDELAKMKFIDAANLFDEAAKDAKSIIEPLETQELATFVAFGDLLRQQVDPDDKC